MSFGYPNTVVQRQIAEPPAARAPVAKTIPFDYVFQFDLTGTPTNRVQDVVEISMQGVFVAVSLGYSFVLDERKTPRAFPPATEVATQQEPIAILFPPVGTPISFAASLPPGATGISEGLLIVGSPGTELTVLHLDANTTPSKLILGGSPPGERFDDITSALNQGETDRVTLGPDGTAAIEFTIPATGALRIWDRTNNRLGQPLEIDSVVIGPDPRSLRLPGPGDAVFHVYGPQGSTLSVFRADAASGSAVQLSSSLALVDPQTFFSPGTTPIQFVNSNGGIARVDLTNKPLIPGDLLIVHDSFGATATFTVPRLRPSAITLGSIAAGMARASHNLANGFKVNSRFAQLFAADIPLDQASSDILASAFEPGCGADDLTFLYAIDVPSTGRELQNKPIHNIAGLGIANGDRPFRPLARPISFEARTSIRIQVEEISTLPGTLYIVLQGYKTLGTGRITG